MTDTYFIKQGYRIRERLVPYHDTEEDSVQYQRDVYEAAASLASSSNLRSVVDIGCGHGLKLKEFLKPVCHRVVGVDEEHSVTFCREKHDFGVWVEDDIEHSTVKWNETFDLVISADVIEHLVNPDRLLAYIRQLCADGGLVVLSTPERDLRRGFESMGPPNNTAHVREWNQAEFNAYLLDRGFEILESRIVDLREGMATCQLVVCRPD